WAASTGTTTTTSESSAACTPAAAPVSHLGAPSIALASSDLRSATRTVARERPPSSATSLPLPTTCAPPSSRAARATAASAARSRAGVWVTCPSSLAAPRDPRSHAARGEGGGSGGEDGAHEVGGRGRRLADAHARGLEGVLLGLGGAGGPGDHPAG